MKVVRAVGVLNLLFGLVALLAPVKFYSFAMRLFTPDVSPPFGVGAIQLTTLMLFIPSLVLIANGAALLFLSYRLETPAKAASSPTREYLKRLSEEEGLKLSDEGEEFELFEGEAKEELEETPGYALSQGEEYVKVRHEMIGKEVYDKRGNYYGRVISVTLGEEGDVREFLVKRGDRKRVFSSEDVEANDGVILVRRQD
ncbi:PRC-barrel domain-containing protein [Candidatus Pyrohabitans sp.]